MTLQKVAKPQKTAVLSDIREAPRSLQPPVLSAPSPRVLNVLRALRVLRSRHASA